MIAAGVGSSPERGSASSAQPTISRRARLLTLYWQHYRATLYDQRARDWNGDPLTDPVEHEAIAREMVVPPGFTDVYGSQSPLKFRKPSAPQNLVRQTVRRFTALLFGTGHHPQIAAQDAKTTDWLNAAVEAGRLWARMSLARDMGGGMGTSCVGFTFSRGKPVFEVHDPRWCSPRFVTAFAHDVAQLEVRYAYSTQEYDHDEECTVTKWWWHRRLIDSTHDRLWAKVAVDPDGQEPQWNRIACKEVEHGFTVCPVAWIQNTPSLEGADGDPDCHGAFDQAGEVDRLIAQANRGILANCDPTLVVDTDDEPDDGGISKGSDSAIYLSKGGGARYLEINGSGPKAAYDAAEKLEQRFCRMVGVVLDQAKQGNRTATEVDQDASAMWERVGALREQYGELGVKALLEKLITAARAIQRRAPRRDPKTGALSRSAIVLPPRKVVNPDTGAVTFAKRELPDASIAGEPMLELTWPPLTTPVLGDADTAQRAASGAINAGLLDTEHAAAFIAPYFKVEDPAAMLRSIKAAEAAYQEAQSQQAMSAIGQGGEEPGTPEVTGTEEEAPAEQPAQGGAEPGIKIFAYEIEDGVVTINEVRATKGLGPLLTPEGIVDPDGNMTLPRYKAKHAELFQAAASADESSGPKRAAAAVLGE
jgi:hypothetical protein